MQRHNAMHEVSDDDRCAECGHKKNEHGYGACAVRLSSSGKRDVYCPCGGFRPEAPARERPRDSIKKKQ